MTSVRHLLSVALLSAIPLLVACDASDTTEGTAAPQAVPTCEDRDLDLAETGFGYHLLPGFVAYGSEDLWWDFEVKDNRFDPCADLSWVVVSGVTHDFRNTTPGSEETRSEAVLLFHRDTFLKDHPTWMPARVTDVVRDSDDTVTVTYRDWGENYHDDFTAPYDVTYTWTEEGLRIDGADPEGSPVLDFSVAPLPTDRPVGLHGNVHHRPWDEELEAGLLTVPMGGSTLHCAFDPWGSHVSCENRDDAVFPPVNTYPDGEVVEKQQVNGVTVSFTMPFHLESVQVAPGSGAPDGAVPDEAVTKIGPLYVDTRGDRIILRNDQTAFRLADGVAEHAEDALPDLDTSRWPTDLEVR